jgi:hypothetical protein
VIAARDALNQPADDIHCGYAYWDLIDRLKSVASDLKMQGLDADGQSVEAIVDNVRKKGKSAPWAIETPKAQYNIFISGCGIGFGR